jgi:hypothetical protein
VRPEAGSGPAISIAVKVIKIMLSQLILAAVRCMPGLQGAATSDC